MPHAVAVALFKRKKTMYNPEIAELLDRHAHAKEIRDYKLAMSIEDEIAEIEMRQTLRRALFAAYALLTNPDAEPEDADKVTALIKEALEETAP